MSLYNDIVASLEITNPPVEADLGSLIKGLDLPRKVVKGSVNFVDHLKLVIASLSMVDTTCLSSYAVDHSVILRKLIESCSAKFKKKELEQLLVLGRLLKRRNTTSDSKGWTKQLVCTVDYILSGSMKSFSAIDFKYLLAERAIGTSFFGVKSVNPETKEITVYWPQDLSDFVTDMIIAAVSKKGFELIFETVGVSPVIPYSDKCYEICSEFVNLCNAPAISLSGTSMDVHNCLVYLVCQRTKTAKQPSTSPYVALEKNIQATAEIKLIRLLEYLMKVLPFTLGSRSIITATTIWEDALPVCRRGKNDAQTSRYSPWGWHKIREVTKIRKGKKVFDAPATLKDSLPPVSAEARSLAVKTERYKQFFTSIKVTEDNVDSMKRTMSLLVQLSQSEKKWLYTRPESYKDLISEMKLVGTMLDRRVLLFRLETQITAAMKGDRTSLMASVGTVQAGE